MHVDDNVELFAQSAIGKIEPPQTCRRLAKAEAIKGHIIQSACRAYEFKVESIDETGPRMSLFCEVLQVSSSA